jgi:hypothetical protein
MVRPRVASLHSLAKVLRKAQPVYTECRSILNYCGSGPSSAMGCVGKR